MNTTVCPDCNQGMPPPYASCKCGWEKPKASASAPAQDDMLRARCDTAGCDEYAYNRVNGKALCRGCIEEEHHAQVETRLNAMGLDTLEKRKAFCREKGKTLFAPSFERWADNMTQATVDRIVRMDTKSDQVLLERLRRRGVIDGRDRIIPAGEARRIAAEAYTQERARRIIATEEEARANGLVEREPGADDDRAAA